MYTNIGVALKPDFYEFIVVVHFLKHLEFLIIDYLV